MTNTDLENIRAVAPKWAGWLCYTPRGNVFWQAYRGERICWWNGGRIEKWPKGCFAAKGIAIDLKTGDIHVQHAGKIVVVSLAEWSAES